MSDFMINVQKIEILLDIHGEVGSCKKKDCDTCNELKRLRARLGRGEKPGAKGGNNKPIFEYTVSDKKSSKKFYKLNDISNYIQRPNSAISKAIANKKHINGFLITRRRMSLEEK